MDRIATHWIWLQTVLHEALVSRAERRRHGDEGQGMVEYALIVVLVALAVIVTVTLVGKKVSNVFSNVSSGLGT